MYLTILQSERKKKDSSSIDTAFCPELKLGKRYSEYYKYNPETPRN